MSMSKLSRVVWKVSLPVILAGASENVVQVFEACKLRSFFDFQPDRDAAIAALAN